MCGAPPVVDMSFTEKVCEDCTPDSEGETYHSYCSTWNEEACACRNSNHDLMTPEKMFEKMLKAMNLKKEEVTV